jgi:AcrR family transcriptional regulator
MSAELLQGREPRQKRAIERVKLILDTAVEMILEGDVNSLKLNDLADRAGIPVGSVYQYFPSKSAVIKRLMDDQFEEVRAMARENYERITSKKGFVGAIVAGIQAIYKSKRDDRLIQEIWAGSQADGLIRHLHDEDNQYHADLMFEKATEIMPDIPAEDLKTRCLLCSVLVDSVIRMAINMDEKQGQSLVEGSVRMVMRELGLTRYL